MAHFGIFYRKMINTYKRFIKTLCFIRHQFIFSQKNKSNLLNKKILQKIGKVFISFYIILVVIIVKSFCLRNVRGGMSLLKTVLINCLLAPSTPGRTSILVHHTAAIFTELFYCMKIC